MGAQPWIGPENFWGFGPWEVEQSLEKKVIQGQQRLVGKRKFWGNRTRFWPGRIGGSNIKKGG